MQVTVSKLKLTIISDNMIKAKINFVKKTHISDC